MNINKIDNITDNTRAELMSIDEYDCKGSPIIILRTSEGNFSNYKSIFDKQQLDIQSLNEGDLLDIEYKTYKANNGHTYKNFTRIKTVADAAV